MRLRVLRAGAQPVNTVQEKLSFSLLFRKYADKVTIKDTGKRISEILLFNYLEHGISVQRCGRSS